jgi:hypothetical protein
MESARLLGMWIETEPGKSLREAWVYLTPEEARELLTTLTDWAEDEPADDGWHTHITDKDRELTVAIAPEVGTEAFARRFNPHAG